MLGLDERNKLLTQLGLKQWYARFKFKSAKQYSHLYRKSLDAQSGSDKVLPLMPGGVVQDDERIVRSEVDLESISPDFSETEVSVSKRLILSDIHLGINALDICLVETNRDVLVIFEKDGNAQLDVQISLLKSIFKSIKVYDELALNSVSFEWPVFKAAVLKIDQQLSFDEVFRRWISDVAWPSYKYVFYFGYHYEQIEHLLLDVKSESRSECLFMHINITLSDIVSVPTKKRTIWERLSKLDWFNG